MLKREELSLKDKALLLKSAMEKMSGSFDEEDVEDRYGMINSIMENVDYLELSEGIFDYNKAVIDVISLMIIESNLNSNELRELFYIVKNNEDNQKQKFSQYLKTKGEINNEQI